MPPVSSSSQSLFPMTATRERSTTRRLRATGCRCTATTTTTTFRVTPVAIDEREERSRRAQSSWWTLGAPGPRDDMENGKLARENGARGPIVPMVIRGRLSTWYARARETRKSTCRARDDGTVRGPRRVTLASRQPNGVRAGCIGRAHSLSGGRSSLSPVPSSLPSSSRARFRVRGDSSALDANGLACCPWVG